MLQSFDSLGSPSRTRMLRPLSDLRAWREAWADENVFRTIWLFDQEGRPARFGPFYLDLDADDGPDGAPDLEAAAVAARRCVELLRTAGARETDLKVWSTGHKGFNVEARPEAVGVDDPDSWFRKHVELEDPLRRSGLLNRVSLDYIFSRFRPHLLKHHHVRLAGSKNVWLAPDGAKVWRTKREVSVSELFTSTGPEIAGGAES